MSVCYFLGAGASVEFGVPLTSEIMVRIWEGVKSGGFFGSSRWAEEQEAKLRHFFGTVFPGIASEDVPPPGIIDVLSLLDFSIHNSTSLMPGKPVAELRAVRELLEIGVCKVISGSKANPNPQALSKFWKWISDHNNASHGAVSIISTNYDILLENVMTDPRGPAFGYDQIAGKVDFGFDWRAPHREAPYSRPVNPWLRYYKLHGSLNWLRCNLCDHIYFNAAGEIWSLVMTDERNSANECHCGHGKLGLVVVAPSHNRDVREPNLAEIWRHAIETLRTADEWVIAGYSLPADDLLIRSMMIRAYAGRAKAPKVTVVGRRADPERDARFRLLFPQCRFSVDGFVAHIEGLV